MRTGVQWNLREGPRRRTGRCHRHPLQVEQADDLSLLRCSKEELFKAVLEAAYSGIRTAEQKLHLDAMETRRGYFHTGALHLGLLLKNPEFLTLVNSENLHRARHLKTSETVREE